MDNFTERALKEFDERFDGCLFIKPLNDDYGETKSYMIELIDFLSQTLDFYRDELMKCVEDEIKDASLDYYFKGDGSDNSANEMEAMEISEFICERVKKSIETFEENIKKIEG